MPHPVLCILQRHVLGLKQELSTAVYQLFTDFKKAYNLVRKGVLCNIVSELGIPVKLIRLIKMHLSEPCNKVRIGQCSSAKFRIQNCLKQEDALWSLLFNFASESVIRAVLVNQQRLKSNETHQLLIFTDSFNTLGSNPTIIANRTQKLS